MRKLTQAAKVAKIIKKQLMAQGIKCRAKSNNFSMGNSVDITVYNQPPEIMEKLNKDFGCYEYGTFDAMTDCQGTKNREFTGPQTKYLHIKNDISDEVQQTVKINKEKNGIEIYFTGKPPEATRIFLKANSWRWSRFNKCWYNKKTPKNMAFALLVDKGAEQPKQSTPKKTKTGNPEKFRTLADKMQDTIDGKFSDRQENTPKRVAQANHTAMTLIALKPAILT